MGWIIDTRNDSYGVYASEGKNEKLHAGVLEFNKVAGSNIYECSGNGDKKHVHVVVKNGVVSGSMCDMKAFVEVVLVAEVPRLFAGHVSVLCDGEMLPYSVRERRFVTEKEFMHSLSADGYPIREIVDFLRRMKDVSTEGYQTTGCVYS